MGKREVRMSRLVEVINSCGYMPIKELAQMFHVSEMTIRRDLAAVERSGLVKNVNGVVVNTNKSAEINREYVLETETKVQNEAKVLIGHFAAGLIEPGDCVIFDTGTTTEQIAKHLSSSLEMEAVCFTFNVMEALHNLPNVRSGMAGGYYHPGTQMFISEEGVRFIQSIRANTVFLSAAGVHESLGISCANSYEVPMKQAILRSACQRILVVDSSKFGVVRSAYFCDLDAIDIVITDEGLSKDWCALLKEKGITVYLV